MRAQESKGILGGEIRPLDSLIKTLENDTVFNSIIKLRKHFKVTDHTLCYL